MASILNQPRNKKISVFGAFHVSNCSGASVLNQPDIKKKELGAMAGAMVVAMVGRS